MSIGETLTNFEYWSRWQEGRAGVVHAFCAAEKPEVRVVNHGIAGVFLQLRPCVWGGIVVQDKAGSARANSSRRTRWYSDVR